MLPVYKSWEMTMSVSMLIYLGLNKMAKILQKPLPNTFEVNKEYIE